MAALPRITHKIFGRLATFATQMGKFGSLKNGAPAYAADASDIQSLANWEEGLFSAVVGNNSPAIEDINGVLYHTSRQIGYLFEKGMPEYDASTTYYTNSYCSYGGLLYKSLVDNNTGNTPSSSPTFWFSASYVTLSTFNLVENITVDTTVAANALTIQLKGQNGNVFSATNVGRVAIQNGSGGFVIREITADISTVISSGSTLGHINGSQSDIHVYLMDSDSAGAMKICYSTFDITDITAATTTTAEGGAGAADSASILYSDAQYVAKFCQKIGVIKSTQATAGTWATNPTTRYLSTTRRIGKQYLRYDGYVGYGSTNNKILQLGSLTKATGDWLVIPASTSTAGGSFTAACECKGEIVVRTNDSDSYVGVTVNSAQLTTSIVDVMDIDAFVGQHYMHTSASRNTRSIPFHVQAGDILRLHGQGTAYTSQIVELIVEYWTI